MEKIKVRVYAKTNLNLDIKGQLDNGYHLLEMLVASIGIYDEVSMKKSQKSAVYMDGILQDETNTATKALELLELAYGYKGIVQIKKGIPLKAGLGGSSADAAAVFYCYSKLYGIELDSMKKLALQVGSDVVFMLKGGLSIVKGIGEIIIPLDMNFALNLVVIQKEYGAETKQVYKKYDELKTLKEVEFKINNKYEVFNVLEKSAISLCPSIKDSKSELLKYTNKVYMSGSGSAVIGIFDKIEDAKQCFNSINGYRFKQITTTLPNGIEIIESI